MMFVRRYHSRRMRTHQSTVAKLDNIFKPIESMFEESVSDSPSSPSGGVYAEKRRQEKLVRPLPFITKYIESTCLGSPRTAGEFRALVNKKHLAVRFLDQLKPKAAFLNGALKEEDLPLATLPEIAVVGRSNSGKSSLINAIVGTRCCRVENKPGATKELMFFKIGDPPMISFVDVPGFGFAYESESKRTQWAEFSLWFLRARRNLRCVLLVVDARHGLTDCDSEIISFLKKNKVEHRIVVNKCDLVDRSSLAKRLTVMCRDLSIIETQFFNRVVPVSALRQVGVDRIRAICESFKMKREIMVGGVEKHVNDLLEERRLKRQYKRASETVPKILDHKQAKPIVTGSCFETEPNAYKPDGSCILKRIDNQQPVSGGDVRILEFENFVSDDEIVHLGIRRGGRRYHLPPPAPGTENTHYESKMKLNHSLEWKMQLELDEARPVSIEKSVSPKAKTPDNDISNLGYISTDNLDFAPKGIKRWKVMGMKPVIKTSRKKPIPETAQLVNRK